MLEKLRDITARYELDMGRIEQVDKLVEQLRVDTEEELRKKVNEKLVSHEFNKVTSITKDISELAIHENKETEINETIEDPKELVKFPIQLSIMHRKMPFVRAVAECYPEYTVLLAGSQVHKDPDRSIPPEVKEMREEAKNSGELVENEKELCYDLIVDKKFNNPMSAGLFVVGDNEDVIKGLNYWTIVETREKLTEITESKILISPKE